VPTTVSNSSVLAMVCIVTAVAGCGADIEMNQSSATSLNVEATPAIATSAPLRTLPATDATIQRRAAPTTTVRTTSTQPKKPRPRITMPTIVPPTILPPTTTTTTTTLPPVATGPVAPAEASNGIGSIEIPSIGLTRSMYEGIGLSTLDYGPGHWPGTAMPGETGNAVIAGHRVSHHADFRNLQVMSPGDEVIFNTGSGRHVYSVVSTEIVQPDALWIIDQTSAPTATLFACHPPGSVSQRIVVHLLLVS